MVHGGPQLREQNTLRPVLSWEVRGFGLPTDRLRPTREDGIALIRVWDHWLEVPAAPGWMAAYRLVPQAGSVVIGEARLFPAEPITPGALHQRDPGRWAGEFMGDEAPVPRGGLTARLLRQLRPGEHSTYIGQILEASRARYGRRPPFREAFYESAEKPRRQRRRSRKGRDDVFLAQLARDYVRAVESGDTKPRITVARRWRSTPTEIRDALHQARRRGLLAGARHGKRGGILTASALALLVKAKRTRRGPS